MIIPHKHPGDVLIDSKTLTHYRLRYWHCVIRLWVTTNHHGLVLPVWFLLMVEKPNTDWLPLYSVMHIFQSSGRIFGPARTCLSLGVNNQDKTYPLLTSSSWILLLQTHLKVGRWHSTMEPFETLLSAGIVWTSQRFQFAKTYATNSPNQIVSRCLEKQTLSVFLAIFSSVALAVVISVCQSVGWSSNLVQIERFSKTIQSIAMKLDKDIHSPKRMNPNDSGDPFLVKYPDSYWVDRC